MKVAIYSRKSKFTGKGESIENQIQMCKEYTHHQLMDKDISEFLIYEDEGYSGGNINRPKFQRLIEDAKLKIFDILICYRLDRISRNVADFSNTLEILQKYNIDFISIREQFDTSTPMGRAMIYIASVFAQLERETIAERIRDNMVELAKTGRWLGGTNPIGYTSQVITYFDNNMKERKMVKLIQVPEELKIVKLIYNKYLQFKSLQKVQTFLLQDNYKTKKGANFDKSTLRIILSNPVYVKSTNEVINYLENERITTCGDPDGEHGLLTYNKQKTISTNSGKIARVTRDKDEWIAAVSSQKGIIEANEWIEAQKILTENKDKFPNQGKTHNALLSNVLRCAICNSTMQINHGHTSKKTGKKNYYYACSMKKNSKGIRCNNKNAKVSELDEIVLNKLKDLSLNKKDFVEDLKFHNKKFHNNNSFLNKKESINKSIDEKEKRIDNLMNKLSIYNDIDNLIINKIEKLKTEILELKKELENINNMKSKFTQTEISISFIEMLLNKCSLIDTLNTDEKQQLINALIDNITWDGEKYEMEINFIGNKELIKK